MPERPAETELRIEVVPRGVEGEIAIALEPGIRAETQARKLDRPLATPLAEAAAQMNLVLSARPSAYAFVQPKKDEQGRTRFLVRGREEGDRLVPSPRAPDGSEDVPVRMRAPRRARARRRR